MSESSAIKYIETAPESVVERLAQALRDRQEKIETDKAIARALDDIKHGRVYTQEEFDKKLKEKFGI
jgi:predicted transcriptional regulator